jgi:hypothetical protein
MITSLINYSLRIVAVEKMEKEPIDGTLLTLNLEL